MNNKTFLAPAISCGHCVRSIQNELGELAGVTSVKAEEKTKLVSVAWDERTSWDAISAAMSEMGYPAQELIQL